MAEGGHLTSPKVLLSLGPVFGAEGERWAGRGLTSPGLTSLTPGSADSSCHVRTILFQAATGEETQQIGQV